MIVSITLLPLKIHTEGIMVNCEFGNVYGYRKSYYNFSSPFTLLLILYFLTILITNWIY